MYHSHGQSSSPGLGGSYQRPHHATLAASVTTVAELSHVPVASEEEAKWG